MQTAANATNSFTCAVWSVIVYPAITLLIVVAVLIFIFGIVEFLAGLSGVGKKRDEGKLHMLMGIIGLVIMVSTYSIFTVIRNTVGGQNITFVCSNGK